MPDESSPVAMLCSSVATASRHIAAAIKRGRRLGSVRVLDAYTYALVYGWNSSGGGGSGWWHAAAAAGGEVVGERCDRMYDHYTCRPALT